MYFDILFPFQTYYDVLCSRQVLMEIKKNCLQVYELPPCDDDEDDSFKTKDKQMKAVTTFMMLFSEL